MSEQDQPAPVKPTVLQDSTGATSSMRVVMLLYCYAVTGLIIYLTIHDGKFPEVPSSIAEIFAALMTGKVLQAFAEKWHGGNSP